jgi:hypothetical protein
MLVMTFYVVTETLDVYTPSSKRWSVTTGVELPLVKILDEKWIISNIFIHRQVTLKKFYPHDIL